MLPKVSIYILNYNYGRFISKAIESCVSQTFKDIEIIIIDDGSTDDSKKIINLYTQKYPSLICRFNNNQGLIKSCNTALKIARGKYILRLDADDWLDRNAIEIMYNKMEKNKDVELLFPDYYEVDKDDNILHTIRRHDFIKAKLLDVPAHGACTLFRKKTLLINGGYDENFSCQDGVEIWLRFYKKFKVMNLNLPLFYYRRHGENLTVNKKKILDNRNRILSKHNNKKFNALAYIPIRGKKYDKFSQVLTNLGNKKLIDWTIESLSKVKTISHILISSPDENILKYVKKLKNKKIIPIKRNLELSTQGVIIEDSMIDSLKKLKKIKFDYVVMSKLNNPFRNSKHIENALNLINIFELDRVFGVYVENKIYFRHDGNTLKPLRYYDSSRVLSTSSKKINVRVESEEIYKDSGSFIIYDKKSLYSKKKDKLKIGHENLDYLSAYQIDNQFDWLIADKIAKEYKEFESL